MDKLTQNLEPLKSKLKNHNLYNIINTPEDLRVFCESHVFAVWDFMSILKSLQSKLTCVTIPWIPSGKGTPSRLLNEIVVEEESDMDPHGQHMSHFEMYCHAMHQAGANTESIDSFLQNLKTSNVSKSLIISNAPTAARNFVNETFKILDGAEPHVVASMFTFGREEVIPEMFKNIIKEMDSSLHGKLKLFRYYLDRHIGLDEDEHTPTALRMVKELCENNKDKWAEATTAAKYCMNARIKFWDEILEQMVKD